MSAEVEIAAGPRRFRLYPAYKASKVEWLGDIPSDWNVVRNLGLFADRREKGFADLPIYSVTQRDGVIPQDEVTTKIVKASDNKDGYKRIHPGDLVYNKMRMWQGAIGTSPATAIVSPAYVVCSSRADIEPRFFEYLYRTPLFVTESGRHSYGICDDMNSLRFDDFKGIYSIVPPFAEQQAIAKFLDRETEKTDALVAKKERLIELLQEKRTALLERLVAGNDDRPIVRLGYYVDLLPGFAFPSARFSSSNEDVRLLRGVNISPGSIRWDETVYWPKSDAERYSAYELCSGDLVFGMDRPWIGSGIRVAEVRDADASALLLQRVARLRAKNGLSQKYLYLLLSSPQFSAYFEPILTGISVPHVSPEQIRSFEFRFPDREDQENAVTTASREQEQVSDLVIKISEAIERLQEFRTALISAAVTGKIDVREES